MCQTMSANFSPTLKIALIVSLCPHAMDGVRISNSNSEMSYNGRRPATLPEPIKRARDKDLHGFAGEGNVVERSERHASVAKPKGP